MDKIIVIIDDEKDIVELISIHLTKSGYKSKGFYDAHTFLSYLTNNLPDLIILDLMLPDIDGLELCKMLKSNSRTTHVPIIMLTAKSEEVDKVLGLELGADDYVTKPFSPRELIARVKAVLRREKREPAHYIKIGDELLIDMDKYEVFVNDRKINLTTTEFKILKLLSEHKGWVYSREKIMDYLWGEEKAILDRTIDVHIKNLREKLGTAGKYVINVRGIGYKIQE